MQSKSARAFAFIKKYCFLVFAAAALWLPDLLLRTLFPEPSFSEAFVGVVSHAFSAMWILFFLMLCVFLPKTLGRILYIVINLAALILSVSQYIYYKIFGQLFKIKSIALAGEGGKYLQFALEQVDARLIVFFALTLIFLLVSAMLWNRAGCKKRWACLLMIPLLGIFSAHMYMQPALHGDDGWDSWRKPRVIYKHLNDVNKSFETAGLYQLTMYDTAKTLFGKEELEESERVKIERFFDEKGTLPQNRYTGLFRGKNVICVMMESIDSWMISEKYTPTIHKMMQNGFHFTKYIAPFFGSGFTFSSEFAFNTGHFTPSSAVSASIFSENSFPYAMANLFKEKGYAVNSFHFNTPDFYNRGVMHEAFGYEKYHSIQAFGIPEKEAELDSAMMETDAVYEKMTEKTPFCDFVITYSAHLPYNTETGKMALAKEKYPELIDEEMAVEKNNAMILAKDTDKFFELLLQRLEEDGILRDTVIVCYTDHFAYGISDEALLAECKNGDINHRVPAFIYAPWIKNNRIEKPMMTVDWLPTIVNLFDLPKGGKYIGGDILAPENGGFAYFETYAWMDERMHYTPKTITVYTPEEEIYIEKQNKRVRDTMAINDSMVMGDYYKAADAEE